MLSERFMIVTAGVLMSGVAAVFVLIACWGYAQDLSFYWSSKPIRLTVDRVTVRAEEKYPAKGRKIFWSIEIQAHNEKQRKYLSAVYAADTSENMIELQQLRDSQGKQLVVWTVPDSPSQAFQLKRAFPTFRLADIAIPLLFMGVCIFGTVKTIRKLNK